MSSVQIRTVERFPEPEFSLSDFNVLAAMGSLVELSCHFNPARQAVCRTRAIPCAERTS
ncbi:MAG: hypothetical protein KA375_14940 [Vitreoscilla sp.]|nr:hypothetical protein [Vitreoscilla sp.]